MTSFRLICLLFIMVPVVLLHAEGSEEPMIVSHLEKPDAMRWDVLEALTHQIHFDSIAAINNEEYDRFFMWIRYNTSSRSDRPKVIGEISQTLSRRAYVDRVIDLVGVILFGPKKAQSIIHSRTDYTLPLPHDEEQCLKSSLNLFEKYCGILSQHGTNQILLFKKICKNVVDKASIEEALIVACGMNNINQAVINVKNPRMEVFPAPVHGSFQHCGRVTVSGVFRMNLQSYAKAHQISLEPSLSMPYDSYKKIKACFHRNSSLGLCQCENDDWRSIKELSSFMSPYEQIYVDVKFEDGVSGFITVTLDEVSHGWRYGFLAVGVAILFLAPYVSRDLFPGGVHVWVDRFIKWALRILAVAFIFLSSIDTSLAMIAVGFCLAVYIAISCITWHLNHYKSPCKLLFAHFRD